MDYECIGVLSQLYRGHRVERPAFYLERSGREDKIEPFDVISEVEEGVPAGLPARQRYVASPVGRSATHFRKTPNTGKLRVMRRKRVSKPLKIAVEWTPGAEPERSTFYLLWPRAASLDPTEPTQANTGAPPAPSLRRAQLTSAP